MKRIIIFANGVLPDIHKAHTVLREGDYVICADGGTRHALEMGIKPDLIVGDMDSAQEADLQSLQADGVTLASFPRDKNETDLELALVRAVELVPEQIVVVAALGGRVDQTLGNMALLADARLSTFDVRLDDGVEEIFLCRGQVEVQGGSGDIVSLIPWGAPVHHIRTQGLRWALDDETLYPEKTRGISNEMLEDIAIIEVSSGALLVVHTRKS